MIAVKLFGAFLMSACIMYVVTTVWSSWADDEYDEGD